MENIYIISDVHGCYKTLLALIEQFPNKQNSKIVFVGDLHTPVISGQPADLHPDT